MSQREPWPWSKIENYFNTKTPTPGRAPAVLFASGNLSPAHRGHVLMLHQAEDRLRRSGHEVLGAWLSPSHDLAVLADAKERGAPELRHEFRLRLAELTTSEDKSIAVGSWESEDRKVHTDQEVARSLYDFVNGKYGSRFRGQPIKVFCVCGCDHMVKFKLQRGFGGTNLGVVVVPRENTDEVLLEKPNSLVFVAESTPGEAAALSSTQLRQAIIDGDKDYIQKAMHPQAARCVLQPTLQEQQVMRIDFEHLGVINPALDIINTDSPWPTAKLTKRLSQLSADDVPAVLIVSGSFSPVHNGHFAVLKHAAERLERAGYKIIAGFFSPQNATGAAMEMRAAEGSKDEVALSTGFRLTTTRIAASDDASLSLGAWEASVLDRVVAPMEVMTDLHNCLFKSVPGVKDRLGGNELRIFYAVDPGQANRRKLTKSMGRSDRGIVIVPRADEDCFLLEKPSNLFYVAEPTPCEASIVVARKIRAALQSGDSSYVKNNVPPAVARLLLSPTSTELASMQADFEVLRPQDLGRSSRRADMDPKTLKEANEKFKAVLRAWAGPDGAISIQDITNLLQVLDPSWTNSEINTFSSGAFGAVGKSGSISCDELVDWMFQSAK